MTNAGMCQLQQNNSASKHDAIIIQNIISPYKTLLFNALYDIPGFDFKVIYLVRSEAIREWIVDTSELRFPYEVIFDGKMEDVSQIKIILKLYKILSAGNPEVLVLGGYSYPAFWAGLTWAKKNGKKAILINESHYLDRKRWWLMEKLKQLFVSNCDAALVDGTRHKEYTVRLGLNPERVFIKNGPGPIDAEWYQRTVSQFKKNKLGLCREMGLRDKSFVFVGRFAAEKNIMLLLKAYQRLKSDIAADWGLILVGNGPQKNEIEDYIEKHELEDVTLPGFKEKNELCLYYALSDVFVLPSLSEPWGLVVNEALASDLPVIVSKRCGCYPDIVLDGINGFSFDPTDVTDLSQKMSFFIQDGLDTSMIRRSSREVLEKCTPRKVADIYHEAIASFQMNVDS